MNVKLFFVQLQQPLWDVLVFFLVGGVVLFCVGLKRSGLIKTFRTCCPGCLLTNLSHLYEKPLGKTSYFLIAQKLIVFPYL